MLFINLKAPMPYLGVLGSNVENRMPYLKFASLQSLVQKTKIFKFRTKNTRFTYFGARIWKYNCHIWNHLLRICLLAKFCEIIKIPKFRTKNVLYGYFWARIFKKLLSYLKSVPSNLSNRKFEWKNQNA